jgi:cytochrome c oxidase subunit 3
MMRHGVTMSQGLFGTTFFTLAGIHGLHVAIGLALLLALRRSVASAMFWQFVVAAWMVIFAVVYIWSLA